MKKAFSILSYLPIILLGIGGSVVVLDMWHTAGVGRTKATLVKDNQEAAPTVTPSPVGRAATMRSP